MVTWSILGLPISFVILGALLLWLCVDKKVSKVLKVLMIAGVIWFGLILLYTPSRIMGWPVNTTYDGLPETAVVLSWKIIEPNINAAEAGIYLWMVPKKFGAPEESLFDIYQVDPRYAFDVTLKDTPRCYRLPYEKEQHKTLTRKAREARKAKGILLFKKRSGGKKGSKKNQGRDISDESDYKIIDPSDVMKKRHEN